MIKISKEGLQAGAKKLSTQLLLVLLILGVVAFIGVFIWQSVRIKDMQIEYQQKQAAFASIQERNERLQEHLDFYNSPGYMLYVEKVAREALGMVRPGDTVILTIADKNPNSSPVSSSPPKSNTGSEVVPPAPPKKPGWQNWLGFFLRY